MAARSIALTWQIPAFGVQFDIYDGEAATLTFTRASAAAITSWNIAFNVKQFHGDSTALLTLAGSITDATNGVFTVSLTATHTGTTLSALQSYVFDVWRTDSGSETMMAFGTLTLLERVR